MGRHNKAARERKAKAKEENKLPQTSHNEAAVESSTPPMAAQVSATNSTSDKEKSKAVEFVQGNEDERPQKTVRVNETANESFLMNETGKESGRTNEAMKREGAPRGWPELVNGDVPKVEKESSVVREQKPRVEGSSPVENYVNSGGNSKFREEASSVVRLEPSKFEARQNTRVEGSNPVENKVNGVGYSGQSHSGDFRIAGNGRGGGRGGYGGHQAYRVDKPRVEGSNPAENKVNGVAYSAQSHSGYFRTGGNGRGGLRGGYRHQASESEVDKVNGVAYSAQSHSGYFRTGGYGRGGLRGGYRHQASESEVDNFKCIDSLGRLFSSILRHRAEELRLNMRSDGYVLVNDLMNLRLTSAGLPLSSHSVDDVKEVVRRDTKQRFGLREENGQLLIRANQGHTVNMIISEDLLSPIYSAEEVPVCVHGTYLKNLDAIQKEGLKRMKRLHVHFATGLLKEKGVISGMRSNCQVFIYLDVQKYLKDGMKLYRSENGVILAEGKNGVIPPDYFAKVERVRR